MSMDKVNSTKIHAVFDEKNVVIYETIEAASKRNPLVIVKEENGSWKNGAYINRACELTLFDATGRNVDFVNVGGWKMGNMRIMCDYYFNSVEVNLDIIDPTGILKSNYYGNCFQGFLKAIEKTFALSKYNSWESVELKNQVEILNKEVLQLKSEINELCQLTNIGERYHIG